MGLAAEALLEEARAKGVYFFLPFPDDPASYYLSISIADGLDELGVPVIANVAAGPRSHGGRDGELFKMSSSHPDQAAFVVVDTTAIDNGLDAKAPYDVIRQFKHRAAVCRADLIAEIAPPMHTPDDIPTFVTHSSRFVQQPGWRIPWAFGLTRDILDRIETARSRSKARARSFVRDFRPSFNQTIRQALDFSLVKPLSHSFEIDSRLDDAGRFVPGHYERLAGALGCFAYGGSFAENYLRNEYFRKSGMKMAPVIGDDPFVVRWDSWRFWESLAAGCVTVALDCEENGFELPVMPQNGVHYVGVRLDRVEETVDFLTRAAPEQLATIAEAGRAWALAHYAPKAIALRFIGEMAAIRP
jgi:hypothetical protein